MDTKLRKYRKLTAVRVLIFVLCVAFFTTAMVGTVMMVNSFNRIDCDLSPDDIFTSRDYRESQDLQNEFVDQVGVVTSLLKDYKSEEYVRAGNWVDQGTLRNELVNLYYISDTYSETGIKNPDGIKGHTYLVSQGGESRYCNEESLPSAGAIGVEAIEIADSSIPGVLEAFIKANPDKVNKVKKNLANEQVREYRRLKKSVDSIAGFSYYATDGKYTVTNLDIASGGAVLAKDFERSPAYMIYEGNQLVKSPSKDEISPTISNADGFILERLEGYYDDGLKVYLSFDSEFMEANQVKLDTAKGEMVKFVPLVAVAGLLTVILFLYLAITTGKRDEDGDRPLYRIDYMWTEIQLGVIVFPLIWGLYLMSEMIYSYGGYYDNVYTSLCRIPMYATILFGGITAALGTIGLWSVLSCIRNLKAHTFLKNSIIYKGILLIVNAIKEVYYGGSIMRKIVIVALGICLLSATVFLAPVIFVIILVFAPKWIKRYEEVKKGIDEVKSGNLNYKIKIEGKGELQDLAKGINEISEASNIAVQNELKNQRMKTELISNVSHDLKTPLTSMVSYIDLLKKEGLDSERAPEYLRIIDQKTERLRKLTEDLFEAAKASSGAINVNMERVDCLSLINQSLGEMDSRIKASGLTFIINAPMEKYYAMADGQLLWRVVDNLIGNALKYAQENTRVYIDLSVQESQNGKSQFVTLTVKNMSKSELNINPDELMERFKRGDESRTTDGSGLGLAIAKDLVRLMDGWFEIAIDGDLFKAQVVLNKAEATTMDNAPMNNVRDTMAANKDDKVTEE